MSLIMLLILLLSPQWAWADDLGCFQIGESVPLPPHFINSAGVSTAATSKEAKIYRGTTTEATIADGTFTQRDATNRPGNYVINWDSTGKTAARYTVTYRGTLDGSAKDGGDDQFQLSTWCPPNAQVKGMDAGIIERDEEFTTHATSSTTSRIYCSTDCITVNDENLGKFIACATPGYEQEREIIGSNATSDYYDIGGPVLSAEPDNVTCRIRGPKSSR